jgi:hypothetical protein
VYYAPYRFTVYTEPSKTSSPIGTFLWDRRSGPMGVTMMTPAGHSTTAYPDNLFVCFYPSHDVAMMAVVSENGEGWAEVVYDQSHNKTGWVQLKEIKEAETTSSSAAKTDASATPAANQPAHFGLFQTWLEFMKFNAPPSGVYWLSGVTDYNRSLRTKNEDTAKLISVTIIRKMKVRFVRGNWLLVEALDFEHNTPIGWIRWRDDDGNLMMFPNIVGQQTPIITAY